MKNVVGGAAKDDLTYSSHSPCPHDYHIELFGFCIRYDFGSLISVFYNSHKFDRLFFAPVTSVGNKVL